MLKDNEIVVNPSKLQLMFPSKYKSFKKACLLITITSSNKVELLGIYLDKNIKFK